jgi:hypothetical protein
MAADATSSEVETPPEPIRPTITDINRPFWEACRRGRLTAQRCADCGALRYPAVAVCPACLSGAHEWVELSGRGEVFSFVVVHRGYHPFWAARVPYNVAMIELDEGLRMFSNIVGTPNDQIEVGQRVRVAFERRGDDLIVPVFELDSAPSQSR